MKDFLDRLGACLRRYAELVAVNDELATLETAEAVLRGRVLVVECLLAEGWVPPPSVLSASEHDRSLLAQRPGAVRG